MKCVQISILAKIYGNVNADESIGNRITIKKMYDEHGNVYPFISARAIKFAIRQRLKEKGFKIDPFYREKDQLKDHGKPWEYVDNDIFGYLVPQRGKGKGQDKKRTAPVAISYFKSIRNTPISTDFGARFPREEGTPNIFEVEVAEIIGRLNVLIYEYIGRPSKYDNEVWDKTITETERKKRIEALLDILLLERFVLPKRANSLNIPEYYFAVILLSESGALPIYDYIDYKMEDNRIVADIELLKNLIDLLKNIKTKTLLYIIDYKESIPKNVQKELIPAKVYGKGEIRKLIEYIREWL